ncbi:hypothetical protein PC128_g15405 [Phytophthora cactorum]|nr:hypothetical protein PC128_g15405 [Phytophthora cactorum]
MQGVDRLDQIRGRFSIAGGHSYKCWYKKLALALIIVARSNAYLTDRLARRDPSARDSHRSFITALTGELITGQWMNMPDEGRMLYWRNLSGDNAVWRAIATPPRLPADPHVNTPASKCTSVSSKQIHAEKNRKRRRCIVCRWEDRYPTEVAIYCTVHSVCLCTIVHPEVPKLWMCLDSSWTCWDKYHKFYLPNTLFTIKGNIRRGSKLVAMRSSSSSTSVAALDRPPTALQIEIPAALSTDDMIVAKSRVSNRERNDQGGAERGCLEGREDVGRRCEVESVSETAVV